MLVGYHNHTDEFHPLDGVLPWDIFFGNTRKEVVMQLDTGNMAHADAVPEPFLKKYPGRALTVHLKEFSKTNENALIGEGEMKWQRIFTLCETTGGTKWYIVEQESYAIRRSECVDKCLQTSRRWGSKRYLVRK